MLMAHLHIAQQKTRGIVFQALVAVCCYYMIWCPAISTACAVNFELKRRRARAFTTLDLVTGGSQLRVPKTVFFAKFRIKLDFLWAFPQQCDAGSTDGNKANHDIANHMLHCSVTGQPGRAGCESSSSVTKEAPCA